MAAQQRALEERLAGFDAVIPTAAVPGRPAPKILPASAVEAMRPGSVIVDLAADSGGNCELTRPDAVVVYKGVTILGPSNPPALVPNHASQMYSKNITTFLSHLLGRDGAKKSALELDLADEITRETLLTRDGDAGHPRGRDLLGGAGR